MNHVLRRSGIVRHASWFKPANVISSQWLTLAVLYVLADTGVFAAGIAAHARDRPNDSSTARYHGLTLHHPKLTLDLIWGNHSRNEQYDY